MAAPIDSAMARRRRSTGSRMPPATISGDCDRFQLRLRARALRLQQARCRSNVFDEQCSQEAQGGGQRRDAVAGGHRRRCLRPRRGLQLLPFRVCGVQVELGQPLPSVPADSWGEVAHCDVAHRARRHGPPGALGMAPAAAGGMCPCEAIARGFWSSLWNRGRLTGGERALAPILRGYFRPACPARLPRIRPHRARLAP